MIKCILVEDEPLAQQVMQDHILKTPHLTLIKVCNNAFEAFEVLHQDEIGLIFLDIKMPALNGIDFIRSLKNPSPFIFTTAFSEYAVESYDLQAIDYLLKPVTYERFMAAVTKFLKLHVPPEAEKTYTYFKVNGKFIKLQHDTIIYAQSVKDYIVLNTESGNYITHMTMKYLTALLPEKAFRRVHRSFLVNTTKITSIGRDLLELGEIKIPLGKNYKKNKITGQ